MDSESLLQHLGDELDAFRACLDGDLSVPVEHCGDWTLRDLAEHLGSSNLWAAAAVTELHGEHEAAPAPRDPDEFPRWFEESSGTLLKALDTDPGASAWTFHPPHTVGFWQRRRALEALVHRWDAENALGHSRPLDPVLACEGVAEVFDTTAPRQVARGRAQRPRHALRLHAADTGTSWVYGPGPAVATLTASAEQLVLLLWGRMRHTDAAFGWTGDREAGLRILAGPLTP
ncbi:maleylpyruvate isomerase family mycothiol-dependent enzyme [Streptomyces coelicoflavus]|uniref:Maleylpyruvate isomerase family mycothiol-dependent enzyme n=1 Tax=Streptomyces coelicoflavus TaxID=285562 RepID=A0A7K3PEY9_9ACTN|nr:maleylpyruvate isomerase family mycothiol-dependent enzyme [Streptomyces coelicoflavus]NEB08457.1 maleylpyruvate isomerase family mycothiol-dependent enzyme [Streptomyces coelicoflavus]